MVLTLVPQGEQLFADVNIKNDDVGFVQVDQRAQIKLATYPFQRYGMISGSVVRVSADATEANRAAGNGNGAANNNGSTDNGSQSAGLSTYKDRIALDQQMLRSPQGKDLVLGAGMQTLLSRLSAPVGGQKQHLQQHLQQQQQQPCVSSSPTAGGQQQQQQQQQLLVQLHACVSSW